MGRWSVDGQMLQHGCPSFASKGQRCGAETGGGLWPPVRFGLSVPAKNEIPQTRIRVIN